MTSHTRNRFFDSQLMPRWNHHGHGGGVRFEHWLQVTAIPTPRISFAVRRAAKAARTATCQECGKVFIRGNRARAKTCSPTCAQQMQFGEWWKAKNKPQAACAPCLYRVGYGLKRIAKLARVSATGASEAIKRAGITIDHAQSCAVAARLMLNNADFKTKVEAQGIELAIAQRKVANTCRARLGTAIRQAGAKKSASTFSLIGCSIEFLKDWIQRKFKRGMRWNNHGDWHIDHIVPCVAFDLRTKEGQQNCFHYSNLRPLWAEDNLAKGDKIITCQPELSINL